MGRPNRLSQSSFAKGAAERSYGGGCRTRRRTEEGFAPRIASGAAEGFELVEGMGANAPPAGTVGKKVYERFKEEILDLQQQ